MAGVQAVNLAVKISRCARNIVGNAADKMYLVIGDEKQLPVLSIALVCLLRECDR